LPRRHAAPGAPGRWGETRADQGRRVPTEGGCDARTPAEAYAAYAGTHEVGAA